MCRLHLRLLFLGKGRYGFWRRLVPSTLRIKLLHYSHARTATAVNQPGFWRADEQKATEVSRCCVRARPRADTIGAKIKRGFHYLAACLLSSNEVADEVFPLAANVFRELHCSGGLTL